MTGIVITAREAMRSNEREKDRFGLLERIGERLAGSLYVEETLKRVAEMLVPQFADHCFIELMEGDRLTRRVSTHVQGWSPPPTPGLRSAPRSATRRATTPTPRSAARRPSWSRTSPRPTTPAPARAAPAWPPRSA
nr:hypothetical protein GCM10020093_086800 [Planobispora longispora]